MINQARLAIDLLTLIAILANLTSSNLFGFFLIESSPKPDTLDLIYRSNLHQACEDSIGSFEDELSCISKVQDYQLKLFYKHKCRIYGTDSDLRIRANDGYACCFDRSRFIEETLNYFNYETRHAFIFDFTHGLLALFTPRTPTHASSEVKTSKGWMAVDSNEKIILQRNFEKVFSWRSKEGLIIANDLSKTNLYARDVFVVYGLWSRNGKLFEPFIHGIPKLNVIEFLKYNF